MRAWVLPAIAGVLCVMLGAWLASALRDLRERMHGRAIQARGLQGERDAERVLKAHGYRIRESQARRSYAIEVDGAEQRVELMLDFVVERDGEQLVAEVKTGASAPRIQRAETRRQLLEYQLATSSRCVLLVDPDNHTISEVAFPIDGALAQRAEPAIAWQFNTVIALLIATAIWYWQH